MKVSVYYNEKSVEYLRLTLCIPASEIAMQKMLLELQTEYADDMNKYFRIHDVRSSHDGENAEIDILCRTNVPILGKVITLLDHIEHRQWEK